MGHLSWTFWYCLSSHFHVKLLSCTMLRTSQLFTMHMWIPGQDEACNSQVLSTSARLQWPSSQAVWLVIHLWGDIRATTRQCPWTTWQACHIDTLCRCQPVPWCIDWKICHLCITHVECYTHWLVLQKASYCWDCHIWIRVCCSLCLHWPSHWSMDYIEVSWCSSPGAELHVWRQWVSCELIINTTCQATQKA